MSKPKRPNPLTDGEWEALIYQTPDAVKRLILRLAEHHGVLKPAPPKQPPATP